MQGRGHITNVLLNLPNTLTTTALETKHGQIIGIAMRTVACDQTEQGGLTGTIRARDLPVDAWINPPVEPIKELPILKSDADIAHLNQCLLSGKRWHRTGQGGWQSLRIIG